MKQQCYDLIGDIHGQYEKLEALLHRLGYQPGKLTEHKSSDVSYSPSTWSHPEGRKVIFLGD